MDDSFALQIGTLGKRPTVPVDAEFAAAILTAREGLFDILAAEEKYDLLCSSYLDYEANLNGIALARLCAPPSWDWSEAVDTIQSINRKLMYMLSAVRMYVDHMPGHLGAIHGAGSKPVEEFKRATSVEYDGHLGYRAMYALRNYVQHSGLPVHTLGFSMVWAGESDAQKLTHSLHPKLSIDNLRREKGFKASVLAELSKGGNLVELNPLLRENMSCLSRIHAWVRGVNAHPLGEWRGTFERAATKFVEAAEKSADGLVLAKSSHTDENGEYFSIISDIGARIDRLRQRNACPFEFEKHVVISAVV